jgi:hypothetical protein
VALRINEENNEDVAELFRKKWASKALRGQPLKRTPSSAPVPDSFVDSA